MTIRFRTTLASLLAVAAVAAAAPAQAALTDAQACHNARIKAAVKYASCQAKARSAFEVATDIGALKVASSKCRTQYTATWPKLQAKYAGTFTACDQNRFTDLGVTVRDNLTGLEWEKKTDDGLVHDKDNTYYYSWAGDMDTTNADGNVFDIFLGVINAAFFAGVGDWRLPTREELSTLLIEPYPCTSDPCISATFGPTVSSFTMTSSGTYSDPNAFLAVQFSTEETTLWGKTSNVPVRAVRGGL